MALWVCRLSWRWLLGLSGAVTLLAAGQQQIADSALRITVDAASEAALAIDEVSTAQRVALGAVDGCWSLEVTLGGKSRTILPREAGRVAAEPQAGALPGVRLVWSEFAAVPGLRVEVVGEFTTEAGVSRWQVRVEKPAALALGMVTFPRLRAGEQRGQEALAVAAWMGELIANPRDALAGPARAGQRLAWDYPGRMSLQCLALTATAGPGLYLACDDAAAFRKTFVARTDGQGGLGFEIVHAPENAARGLASYAPAYGIRIGSLHGDWMSAAERYRGWAREQEWTKHARRARGLTPSWVLDTALWVWNRGRSEGVLGPAKVLGRELGLPVSVLWHWWHGCAYDVGFPEYLPPREGSEPFRAALASAQRQGVHALVYMNQRLWGLTTASWREQGAERFAVKGTNGGFRREVYNTFTGQACVSMCLGTAFWRDTYAGLAERAVRELGVDGIYMDQACSSLACFDPTHGHALGGGTYWMQGFRDLEADIRARTREVRPVALAGEGSGEAWLPHLDLMLSLQVSRERYMAPGEGWETIPLFGAVYHEVALPFGSYSSLTAPPYDELWPQETAPTEPLALLDRKYARQFYFEQARSLVWGQQPMLANFLPEQLAARPDEIGYLLRLARLRQRALPWLRDGEFIRAPELRVGTVLSDLSRLSIYAGQRGGVTAFTRELPRAVAGAWRAPDGRRALALASIVDEPLALDLDLSAVGWDADVSVYCIDETGRRAIASPRNGRLALTLPPRGAWVLEFGVP